MKAYIEDLLNRNFIKKSSSSYSVQRKNIKAYGCAWILEHWTKRHDPTATRYPEYRKYWITSMACHGFLFLIRGKLTTKSLWVQTASLWQPSLPIGVSMSGSGYPLVFPVRLDHSNVLWRTVWETWETVTVYPTWMILSIFSATFEDHIENRRKVLRRLKKQSQTETSKM